VDNCFINLSVSWIVDEVGGRVNDELREEAAEDDEEDLSLGLAPPPRPRPRFDISKDESELVLIASDYVKQEELISPALFGFLLHTVSDRSWRFTGLISVIHGLEINESTERDTELLQIIWI
jgi:hypothetical protein